MKLKLTSSSDGTYIIGTRFNIINFKEEQEMTIPSRIKIYLLKKNVFKETATVAVSEVKRMNESYRVVEPSYEW